MDASRYFEEMHRAMSAQKNNSSLLLTVKVQDLGGADAYLELRQSPNGRARVFYSTMGRRNLNFQLFRKGWQLCHNASGEMTGQFRDSKSPLLCRQQLHKAGICFKREQRVIRHAVLPFAVRASIPAVFFSG